jgi:hypothetical protein
VRGRGAGGWRERQPLWQGDADWQAGWPADAQGLMVRKQDLPWRVPPAVAQAPAAQAASLDVMLWQFGNRDSIQSSGHDEAHVGGCEA